VGPHLRDQQLHVWAQGLAGMATGSMADFHSVGSQAAVQGGHVSQVASCAVHAVSNMAIVPKW